MQQLQKIGIFILLLFSIFIGRSQNEPNSVSNNIEQLEKKLESVSTEEKAPIYLKLNQYYWRINPEKAIFYGKKAVTFYSQKGNDSLFPKALIQTAIAFYYNTEYDSAIYYSKRLIDIPQLSEAKKATAHNLLCVVYRKKDNYTEALRHGEIALKSFIASKDSLHIAGALDNLANIYKKTGDYKKSLKYSLDGLRIFEKMKNTTGQSYTLSNISILYAHLKDFKKSNSYLWRAISLATLLKDDYTLAESYNNLGSNYLDTHKSDSALFYFQKALHLYEKVGNKAGIAITMGNIGNSYLEDKDYKKSIYYLRKAIALSDSLDYQEDIAANYSDLGMAYSKINKNDSARYYVKKALSISRKRNNPHLELAALDYLYKVYLNDKSYKKAVQIREKFEKLKDSIHSLEMQKEIAALDKKYETEKKEIENQLLKTENEKKSRNQIFLISISAVLIALVLLLVYYLRLRSNNLKQQKELSQIKLTKKEQEIKHLQDMVVAEKQINQLQKENYEAALEHKNKQLMTSTACIVNKNEVLGKLKVEIKAMNFDFKEKSQIISFINTNIDIDTDWKKFKMDFEEAHPGFFDRLTAAYPDLTETYQKIAAFLRIGLSSQEIADLLFVSIASVNKSRQRLRKKLGLEANADLTRFFMNV